MSGTATTAADMRAPWRQMIPVDRLHPNPDNPREEPGDIAGLAASIREDGLLQHILVRPAPDLDGGHYYIEDGWRRYLAMKDWNTAIPAVIRPLVPGENPHLRNIIVGLVTDVHSKSLGPIERANALGRLRKEFSLTQEQVGRQVGVSGSSIANSLALLELSADTQERVRKGSLTVEDALRQVRRQRAAARRKKGGTGQAGAVWEPDWFSVRHPLARKARTLCDARGHNSRRRFGASGSYPGACGECYETLIREDERLVIAETAKAAARWQGERGNMGRITE